MSQLVSNVSLNAGSAAPRRGSFPRYPLYGAFALLLFVIGITIFGRATEIGTLRVLKGNPDQVLDLRFLDRPGGEIAVINAHSGNLLTVIAPGEDGFIRGAMRGLNRGRKLRSIGQEEPYRLIRWTDGRLTLSDITNGQRVDLNAFGPTNAGAFARFLSIKE